MKPQTQEVTTGFDIPKENDRERPPKEKRAGGTGRGGGRGTGRGGGKGGKKPGYEGFN